MKSFIIFDKKFRKNTLKYIFQCFLASLTILSVLIFLDVLEETAIIASLGASAFIVFTMPTQYSSDPRRIIGGYIVGVLVGLIFYFIANLEIISTFFPAKQITSLVVFGAIAVGFAIFIMAVTNTEHAPAAGIALGLVINKWDSLTIIFIVIAVLWFVGIQAILKKYLMDLISPHINPPQEHKR